MRKSAYVIFVAILVSLQAAICSTARPNTFTGSVSSSAETGEDIDLGDLTLPDKLMGPVGGAIGGFMSHHHRPVGGIPPRGAAVIRPGGSLGTAVSSSTTPTTTTSPPSTSK